MEAAGRDELLCDDSGRHVLTLIKPPDFGFYPIKFVDRATELVESKLDDQMSQNLARPVALVLRGAFDGLLNPTVNFFPIQAGLLIMCERGGRSRQVRVARE